VRARSGVVRTFQNLEVFANMTVLENVMTGRHSLVSYGILDGVLRTPRFRAGERACREAALEKLEFVGLADKKDVLAGELPYGSQRLLEMARAVAAEPRLLLLDEPAAGLNTQETKALGGLIARVRDELGITVGLVEHDMDLVMGISDAVTVLNFGAVLTSGTPAQIQADPEVVAAYLGD
jgi:branched-chain amino acid transport system ATP-binding protein